MEPTEKQYAETYSQVQTETFVREGYILALPLCFPGASTPVEPDESKIKVLAISSAHHIYGVTGGNRPHLFVAMTRGMTGFCFDMGIVPGQGQGSAVVCGNKEVFICRGSNLYSHTFQPAPFDGIQEWDIFRTSFEDLNQTITSGPIVHAVNTVDRNRLIGVALGELFVVDMENKPGKILHTESLSVKPEAKILLAGDNNIYGIDAEGSLWQFDPVKLVLKRNICILDRTDRPVVMCAIPGEMVILAGINEELFRVDISSAQISRLGRVMTGPITTMAATFDRRIFGTAGKEIEHMFCYDATNGSISDIGVCASLFGARRYGYNFADAATGGQGEIFFGEHDRGGHLWIYFPAIRKERDNEPTQTSL